MNRQKLIEAIAEACRECGFEFCTGFAYRMASQMTQMPAAWLEPPKLIKTVGRREGVKYYVVKINLLELFRQSSEQDKALVWDAMEQKASKLVEALAAKEGVGAVTGVAGAPGEFSLTPHGELSWAVEFTVQVPFWEYCTEVV